MKQEFFYKCHTIPNQILATQWLATSSFHDEMGSKKVANRWKLLMNGDVQLLSVGTTVVSTTGASQIPEDDSWGGQLFDK